MGAWTKIDDLRSRVAGGPIAEINTSPTMSLADAQVALRAQNFEPEKLLVMGWELLLSRRRQDGVVRWHFSAKLYPSSRSSSAIDWETLGKIAARVGAPPEPAVMPDDPRAAVHWSWTEQ